MAQYVIKAHGKFYREVVSLKVFRTWEVEWTGRIEDARVFSDGELRSTFSSALRDAKKVCQRYEPCAEVVEVELKETP